MTSVTELNWRCWSKTNVDNCPWIRDSSYSSENLAANNNPKLHVQEEDSTLLNGVRIAENVRNNGFGQHTGRDLKTEETVQKLAVDFFRSNGNGITYSTLRAKGIAKHQKHAQSILQRCRMRGIVFTSPFIKKKPRPYYPTCIKSEIMEKLMQHKDVRTKPTGVNQPPYDVSYSSSTIQYPLYNAMQTQSAQSFLEVLMGFAFKPLYIHRILLMLLIDKQYYLQISQDERPKNRAKVHEEHIGRRHVTYTISPKGTIEVAVATTDTPFKLETDEDEAGIFSFLGQVRDRLTYLINDVRERFVPPIMDWVLKGCDINKDIEINDFKAQLALPDIQLKYVGRVFRLYVKHQQEESVYRVEESIVPNIPIVEALNNIRHPYNVIEEKLDRLLDYMSNKIEGDKKE